MKPESGQFTDQERFMHNLSSKYHGSMAGAHPYAYKVSELQERADRGHYTPISGAELAKGKAVRKRLDSEGNK